MDCSLPGSSVHGIFQARALKWGAIASSGGFVEGLPALSRFTAPPGDALGNVHGGGMMSKLRLSCLDLNPVLLRLQPHGL